MQYLNTFLTLLAKTQSRDKILRLVQYATLHSVDHQPRGPTYNVYAQMRRTRKILRFLRTLEYSSEIRKDVPTLPKLLGNPTGLLLKIFTILQNLFTLLFYIFDHRVVLGQLQLIDKANIEKYYPKSMKMYLLQNVFGSLKSLFQMIVIILEGKYEGQILDMDKGQKILKSKAVQFIKNVLDIFVALYYIRLPKGGAARIGVIGVITSLIGIAQSLKII